MALGDVAGVLGGVALAIEEFAALRECNSTEKTKEEQ
jgi:hypothetical protein